LLAACSGSPECTQREDLGNVGRVVGTAERVTNGTRWSADVLGADVLLFVDDRVGLGVFQLTDENLKLDRVFMSMLDDHGEYFAHAGTLTIESMMPIVASATNLQFIERRPASERNGCEPTIDSLVVVTNPSSSARPLP